MPSPGRFDVSWAGSSKWVVCPLELNGHLSLSPHSADGCSASFLSDLSLGKVCLVVLTKPLGPAAGLFFTVRAQGSTVIHVSVSCNLSAALSQRDAPTPGCIRRTNYLRP